MPIEGIQSIGASLSPARPVSVTVPAIDARLLRQAADAATLPAKKPVPVSPDLVSQVLDPGPAPVDAERVTAIRKAIEAGTYPLLPAKVADAIIAASLLLRNPK